MKVTISGVSQWDGQQPVPGWEMKFEVDSNGDISGSNRNEGGSASNQVKKHYCGTFLEDYLEAVAVFEHGQQNEYRGAVNGTDFYGTVEIIEVGAGPGARKGMKGVIIGKVKKE